jgi:hypothetical protein
MDTTRNAHCPCWSTEPRVPVRVFRPIVIKPVRIPHLVQGPKVAALRLSPVWPTMPSVDTNQHHLGPFRVSSERGNIPKRVTDGEQIHICMFYNPVNGEYSGERKQYEV